MARQFNPSIRVVYDGGLKSDITLTQEDVDRYIKACLHDSCELIRNYARTHHNYKDDSGRLTRAVRFEVVKRAKEGRIGRVYIDLSQAPYGKYIVEGTGLYGVKHRRIFPKRAKALHWFSRRNEFLNRKTSSYEWFKPSVRGAEPDKFLDRAFEKTKIDVNDIFREGLRRLLSGKL